MRDLNELNLKELSSEDLIEIKGGIWGQLVIGVLTYVIAEDWSSFKKGIGDAMSDHFK